MKVNGKEYQTVWLENSSVFFIDQNLLPFSFKIQESKTCEETCLAIKNMTIRGAIALEAAAGYALLQAFLEAPVTNFWPYIEKCKIIIEATRPTARNLFYAVNFIYNRAKKAVNPKAEVAEAVKELVNASVAATKKIGEHGLTLIKDGFNIGTHCNAGWLGCVNWGTALSPIYMAKRAGKKIFVYVDETRPRGQGARLTAWELQNEAVPCAIIADNAAAHYLSKGKIDMYIVGADRIAKNGDTANKIGTLEKAILAKHYGVPFYVAAPLATFDLNCASGADIVIEERSADEILYQVGQAENGELKKIRVCAPGAVAFNPAFDVTPAELITGFITEKGIISAETSAIKNLFS